MKKIKILALFLAGVLQLIASEKYFVVERENSSLAVIEESMAQVRIEDMNDMNHGVVKFFEKDGYAITRDGYVIKFDTKDYKVVKKYKTSKSAIGFIVKKDYVAVANYDDKSVDILDRELNPIQKIRTNSRNVGIKSYKDYLIFSEMDNDKISVLKKNPQKEPFFVMEKEFKDVGVMPFDAMIDGKNYIAGFFKSDFFGVVDLEQMKFSKIKITANNNQRVLKVPHFGFWGISKSNIFVPAVGDNKVMVYTNNFKFVKNIEMIGLPVFAILSPDQNYLAVTFSGENFVDVQIVDTKTLKIIKSFKFDGKVLHARWSEEKPNLLISVNDTNKISVINTKTWEISKEIFGVKKPSGIFLLKE